MLSNEFNLISATDLVASLEEVRPTLKAGDISLWTVDHSVPHDGFNSLLDKLEKVSEEPLPDHPKVNIMSNFLFIFTSGTTGMCCHLISLVSTSSHKINVSSGKTKAPLNWDVFGGLVCRSTALFAV